MPIDKLWERLKRAFGMDQEGDPRVRYHKPTGIKRLLFLLRPDRVSRIHLYEAQERYIYLRRLLENQPANLEPDRAATIKKCQEELDKLSVLLSRRQEDLNFLWREMTQTHKVIVDRVLPSRELPGQLYFCRREAGRIAAVTDPEVCELLQRLAEVMDETNTNRSQKVHLLHTLLERFTTIRTGRMHQQLVNVRTYRKALFVLVPLSILVIANHNLLLGSTSGIPEYPRGVFAIITHLLRYNLIAFVFFGGLVGGFFSVVMRLRSRNLEPGEDVYFAWYVLTKPFVGALGAVILYVLLRAQFVTFNILEPLTKHLTEDTPGPEVFGFALLAGLTERLAFPNLR